MAGVSVTTSGAGKYHRSSVSPSVQKHRCLYWRSAKLDHMDSVIFPTGMSENSFLPFAFICFRVCPSHHFLTDHPVPLRVCCSFLFLMLEVLRTLPWLGVSFMSQSCTVFYMWRCSLIHPRPQITGCKFRGFLTFVLNSFGFCLFGPQIQRAEPCGYGTCL